MPKNRNKTKDKKACDPYADIEQLLNKCVYKIF